MSIRKIVLWNALVVLAVGAYGFLTDEPYFRAVGHAPWRYDYLFGFALALNGPSGVAADFAARYAANSLHLNWPAVFVQDYEWKYAIQYALWLLLLWPQWKLYDVAARRCAGHPDRETSLRLAALGAALLGGVGAYKGWEPSYQIGEFFIDQYFWVVRALGLGLSGFVILLYAQILKSFRLGHDRRCNNPIR